ncbi:MAG: aminomethyl-transferring glycine dehydrogenase subunit GcvPB [Armatimonadetes bacterium]|nr:aminomethyl-transferring glycine dehydrogenase subunit GcvPB [Armatimonadota bacterium]
MSRGYESTLFEKSSPGRRGCIPPAPDLPPADLEQLIPDGMRRKSPPALPELSELQVVRHFVRLSQLNYSVDTTLYPLGSCTMKYNPRSHEAAARLPGFARLHPLQPQDTVQGALELMHSLQDCLQEITGMEAFTLQPAAGAQGELTALLMIAAYFRDRGEKRTRVLVPDSSHGTNPASAALAGFEVTTIRSNPQGDVDLEELQRHLGDDLACLMLTNPSTLGLFEQQITEIARLVHQAGALLYYDGANMNALLGKARPGDMGFDLVHLNLHKTFSTPHGGGGPGAGPVGARGPIREYLPGPTVVRAAERYEFSHAPRSIGRVRTFWGNFLVLVRAYAYIRYHGAEGLREVAEGAVLAANYLLARLKDCFELPFDRRCMHEFVISARNLKKNHGVRAMDVAKRLLDYGFYAPTVYFPLIVDEALMIEPTETEDLGSLDHFADTMTRIASEDAEVVRSAPHRTPVGRLDEVRAARQPVLHWEEERP